MRTANSSGFFTVALILATVLPDGASRAATKGIVLPPVTLRVGAFGAPCTHATLSAAIADASTSGSTVIRLADNQIYNGINVNIIGKNVTIEGGYTDCAADTPQAGARTGLFGADGSGDSVIEIVGGANTRDVLLRNLDIAGGESDADGGGGVEIDGNAVVTFDNLRIFDNASGDGGGVHLSGANGSVQLIVAGGNTGIGTGSDTGNQASGSGGGIYCEQASIRVDSQLAVFHNSANSGGGGLRLDDCDLTVGLLGADPARLTVNFNEAVAGGGLQASNGSLVVLRGERHEFRFNDAESAGGGIWISGQLSSLFADSTIVDENTLLNIELIPGSGFALGGGLYVGDGALADFDGGLPQPCLQLVSNGDPDGACVRFRGNSVAVGGLATPFALGGAIFVSNAELRLRQARLSDNSAPTYGTAIAAAGSDAEVLLESVVIDGNAPGPHALAFSGGAQATVAFATLVDASDDVPIRVLDDGTLLNLHASVIVASPVPNIEIGAGTTVQVSCLIANGGTLLPTIASPSPSTDFVNTPNGDFRPSPTSQLLDRCNNSPYAPTTRDAIGGVRSVDLPDQDNDPGPIDVGAYERQLVALFRDSFEDPLP